MRKYYNKYITWLFIFLLYLYVPLIYSSNLYEVIEDKVNLREDSTTMSHSYGYLMRGEKVDVLKEKYDWYNVVLPQRFSGYVSCDFVHKSGSDKIDGSTSLTINPEYNRRIVVTVSVLNIRESPSLQASIVGKAKKGDILKVEEEKDGWFKITGYPYRRAWVHKNFLRETDKKEVVLSIEEIIPNLRSSDIKKKEYFHAQLIKIGQEAVTKIEPYIPLADQNTVYSIIAVFTEIGRRNPHLVSIFLNKTAASPKISSIYLDIIQNIINPPNEHKAYFYLYTENKLTLPEIKVAMSYLKSVYQKQ